MNGCTLKGLQTVNGARYYFNVSSGRMVCGTVVKAENALYLAAENGKLTAISADGFYRAGSYLYYVSGGKLATGWRQIDGNWYYFDTVEYYAREGTVIKLEGKRYYFSDGGVMMRNGWIRNT